MAEVRLPDIEGIVRTFIPGARLELAAAPAAPASAPPAGEPGTAANGPADEPEIVRLAVHLFGAKVVNVQRKDRNNGNG
jgi:hypothetical protein